jgi:hypothetical protein
LNAHCHLNQMLVIFWKLNATLHHS